MTPSEIYQSLVSTNRIFKLNYIEIGRLLCDLKDGNKFKDAVGCVETWDDFLKQPEIGLSRLESDRLMKIYKKLILDKDVEVSALAGISLQNLKKLTEVEEVTDEIITQAQTLSDKDFKEVLAENKNIETRTYKYMVMRKCIETGNMTKVHGIESEIIKQTFNLNE